MNVPSDDRIAEVHEQWISEPGTPFFSWGTTTASPQYGCGERNVVDFGHDEVDLMDVKVVDLLGHVHNVPAFDRAGVRDEHRRIHHREMFAVDVHSVSVFAEHDGTIDRRSRKRRRISVVRERRGDAQRGRRRPARRVFRCAQVRQHDHRIRIAVGTGIVAQRPEFRFAAGGSGDDELRREPAAVRRRLDLCVGPVPG